MGSTLVALVLAAGGLSACSSGGGSDDEVATLDEDGATDDSAADEGDDDGGGGSGGRGEPNAEFQDAMLEFAECMRDEGIDFPDPQFDGEGGVVIMGGGPGDDGGPPSEAEQQEMEAAQATCEPILEEARDSMPQPSPEEQAEMQDQALEFAECMREHGIDFPDPEFTDDGGISIGFRSGDGEDGEPAGPNPEDEDFQEASEECGGEGGFGFNRVGEDPDEDD